MNDDLNLLITYVSKTKSALRIACKIENGLNNNISEIYQYYSEEDTIEWFRQNLPEYIFNDIDFIINIEEINTVIKVRGVKSGNKMD